MPRGKKPTAKKRTKRAPRRSNAELIKVERAKLKRLEDQRKLLEIRQKVKEERDLLASDFD